MPRRAKPTAPTCLAANLRAWRLRRGLLQKDLAEKVETHASVINRAESGATSPTLELALKLVGALDITPDDLFRSQPMTEADQVMDDVIRVIKNLHPDDVLRVQTVVMAIKNRQPVEVQIGRGPVPINEDTFRPENQIQIRDKTRRK